MDAECRHRLPPWATQIASLSKAKLTTSLPFPKWLQDFVARENLVTETVVRASRMDRLLSDFGVRGRAELRAPNSAAPFRGSMPPFRRRSVDERRGEAESRRLA